MILLSFLCGLFGCGEISEHTTDDIKSFSISCGHMDYSYSYSFYLRKEENNWLLDADFAADSENPHIEYEECPVSEEDIKELFDIIRSQNITERLLRYKKPKLKVKVSDETVYYTSILFADGERLGAAIRVSQEIEDYFYRLAEKYTGTISETNNEQNNEQNNNTNNNSEEE